MTERGRKAIPHGTERKKERRRSHFFLALRATQTVKVLQEIGPSLTEKVKELMVTERKMLTFSLPN